MLVRTDPGAAKTPSGNLVSCSSIFGPPGITISPIRALTGYPTFAEEFFDDVRVPVANRIGDENDGWRIVKALLDVERSNITRAAESQRYLDELIDWCRSCQGTDDDPLRNPVNRLALARLVEKVEVGVCCVTASPNSRRRAR